MAVKGRYLGNKKSGKWIYYDKKGEIFKEVIYENDNLISESKLPNDWIKDFSSNELMKGGGILTLTLFFRNVLKEFPPEMEQVKNGDTFLISLLGEYGKGKYLNNIEKAVYRVHQTSSWSSLDVQLKKI